MMQLADSDARYLQRLHIDAISAERSRDAFVMYLIQKHGLRTDQYVVDIDRGCFVERNNGNDTSKPVG